MARPGQESYPLVLSGIDVLIPYQQAEGSPGGTPAKDTGQNLNPILLHPGRGGDTGNRSSLIYFSLDVLLGDN